MSRWEKDLRRFIEDVESDPSGFSPEWEIEDKLKGAFTMRPKNGMPGMYAEFYNIKNAAKNKISSARIAIGKGMDFPGAPFDKYEIEALGDHLSIIQARSYVVLPENRRFTHGFGAAWNGKGDLHDGFFADYEFDGVESLVTGAEPLPIVENHLEREHISGSQVDLQSKKHAITRSGVHAYANTGFTHDDLTVMTLHPVDGNGNRLISFQSTCAMLKRPLPPQHEAVSRIIREYEEKIKKQPAQGKQRDEQLYDETVQEVMGLQRKIQKIEFSPVPQKLTIKGLREMIAAEITRVTADDPRSLVFKA